MLYRVLHYYEQGMSSGTTLLVVERRSPWSRIVGDYVRPVCGILL